jgi:hypothetical protein
VIKSLNVRSGPKALHASGQRGSQHHEQHAREHGGGGDGEDPGGGDLQKARPEHQLAYGPLRVRLVDPVTGDIFSPAARFFGVPFAEESRL